MNRFFKQEISDLLSGALTSEDEEAVETELNELINAEHQKAIDSLPAVPSEELPVTIPGNNRYYFDRIYNILKHVYDK